MEEENKKTKEKKKKRKKKAKFVDDGHTIYSMEGLDDRPRNKEKIGLTRKERRAAIRAALSVYMPIVLLVIVCFTVVCVLMYFWLR